MVVPAVSTSWNSFEDDERAPFGALVELGREVEQLEQSLLGGADRGDRGDLDPDTG